jgi:Domain of unknown function (DUF892)
MTRKRQLLGSSVDRARFVDRLIERWLHERSAVTLYQLAQARLGGDERLGRFLDEERLHAEMLERLLAEVGVAPREQPAYGSASLAASEMAMLLDAARADLEPRHVVQVLLAAERLDVAGWELLLALAREAGLDEDWLRSFRSADRAESEHEHYLHDQLLKLERAALFSHPAP